MHLNNARVLVTVHCTIIVQLLVFGAKAEDNTESNDTSTNTDEDDSYKVTIYKSTKPEEFQGDAYEKIYKLCRPRNEQSVQVNHRLCVNNREIEMKEVNNGITVNEYYCLDDQMLYISCESLPSVMVTVAYYEYEDEKRTPRRKFTSTATAAAKMYLKLQRKNSPAFIECDYRKDNHTFANSSRLYLTTLSKVRSPTPNIKINNLQLLTTYAEFTSYVYEYFANVGENLHLALVNDNYPMRCEIQTRQLKQRVPRSLSSQEADQIMKTEYNILFNDTSVEFRIKCRNHVDPPRFVWPQSFIEVIIYGYGKLFEGDVIYVEGLRWDNVLAIYAPGNSTNIVRYSYNGDLRLKCIALGSVPEWISNENVIFGEEEIRDENINREVGLAYSTTIDVKLKRDAHYAALTCRTTYRKILHEFVIELVRNETYFYSNSPEKFKVENGIVTATVIIVTAVIIVLAIASTLFKLIKDRKERKRELEEQIVYEHDSIYESIQYGTSTLEPKSGDIQRSPLSPPTRGISKNEAVDISRRPPYPLPVETEEAMHHYDSPYEYRSFCFGRTGPPNREGC